MTRTITIDGHSLTLDDVHAVARGRARVALSDDPAVRVRIEATAALNRALVASGKPIYGVTTGPGHAVSQQVGVDRAARLQETFITFLGCGVGDGLSVEECRALLLARINCLARGYSAVRLALIERLIELLNRDIIPWVPSIGSVGASGDLIPSSYVAAVVMGRRRVHYEGEVRQAADVLAEAGLEPMSLEPKEGLALVNGTSVMAGVGALAILDAERLAVVADACTAMATEALAGIVGPFQPFLHEVAKPHPGQIASAARIWKLLEGTGLGQDFPELVERLGTLQSGVRPLERQIQDNYSIRCAPQCIGALGDAITWARGIVETELNSSNDNPLYDPEAGTVASGGNFSGFHIGLAMDTLKVAVASVADLIDRQFELVNDEKYNNGLGVCCAAPVPDDHPEAGLRYGFKGMQLGISSVTAEALNAATPMTTFSRSTACHTQDKVSMGATAARQAREIVGLTEIAAAMHLLILAQAADLRGADKLAPGTRRVYDAIRRMSAFVESDRELEDDIQRVLAMIRSGELATTIDGWTGTNP
jgi:histidine ammonia-lyase/phenylalanine ammonia-lyase